MTDRIRKLLIAGYPKSGNTWIGYLCSHLLGARYIDLHRPNAPPTSRKDILDQISRTDPPKTAYSEVCKSHLPFDFTSDDLRVRDFDKIIHIVRDPRDVAVSLFYFNHFNVPASSGRQGDMLSKKSWLTRAKAWKRTVREVAAGWSNHTVSWLTYDACHRIKYEDLVSNPVSSLLRISDFLEITFTEAELAETVELFSFERLSGGRSVGQENKTSFFRKGVVGDHTNHFDRLDRFFMRKAAGDEMRILGYDG